MTLSEHDAKVISLFIFTRRCWYSWADC